jgi:hypothetical protein
MEEWEYITKDALMMCDQGGAPDFFKPTYNSTVKVHGCMVATAMDAIPLANIPSFKICKITQGPCIPATIPLSWLDTYQVKIKGVQSLIGASSCKCMVGGTIEFMTSGQIPLPAEAAAEVKEMQTLAKKALDDSGHGDSVGETGFVEGMIPIWGSGRDMINDIQTGDVKGTVINAGFLVWDAVSIVAGIFSFGAGAGFMQGLKNGVKGAIKAGAKLISKDVLKQLGKTALRKLSKQALKESIDTIAKTILRTCVFACFPEGTRISTATGFKNIQDIQTGDQVWAYDETTGNILLEQVTDTMQQESDHTVFVYTDQELIETTAIHPFYTEQGWKDASELQVNDKILTRESTHVSIEKIEFSYEAKKVYNFEVENSHTYFVGNSKMLVHNAARCATKLITQAKKLFAETFEDLAKYIHCFVAGTLVKTRDGHLCIEDLKKGQQVYAYDFEANEVVIKRILNTYKSTTDSIVEIIIANEIIKCTKTHRIWIETEKEWLAAENIKPGMGLLTAEQTLKYVDAIAITKNNAETYNLEIEDVHNYFVSTFDILVHNENPFPNSIYNDLTKRPTEIYRYFDPVTKKTVYVGKTVQGVEKRASQHAREKGLEALLKKGKLKYEIVEKGMWNAFQTATREQHYMMKYGTKVERAGYKIYNKINALSPRKWQYFKDLIKCP